MSTATISIQGVRERYRPGETVCGSVRWSANATPRAIEVRLFWMTSGLAPRQIGPVATITVAQPNRADSSRFEFVLPEGPWTFEGALARLDWVIEAVMLAPNCNGSGMFSLGPDGWQSNLYPNLEPSGQQI